MKTSKFFLSTLIAASAMTATAYADYTWDETRNYAFTWDFSQDNTKNEQTGVLGGTVSNTFVTEDVPDIGTAIKEGSSDGQYWETGTNSFFYDALQEVTSGFVGTGTLTFSVDYYYTGAQWGENILHVGRHETGIALGLSNGYVSFALGTAVDDSFATNKTNLKLTANAWNTVTWTLVGDSWCASLNGGDAVYGGLISDIAWDGSTEERNKYSIGIKAPGWKEGATGLNDSGCKIANLSVSYGLIDENYLTWAGGETGGVWEKSSTSWENGDTFSDGALVKFATPDATITVSGSLEPRAVTISENTMFTGTDYEIITGVVEVVSGKTLTLAGAGTVSTESLNNSGTISINSESTLNTTSVTALGTITGSGKIAFGTGDVTPGTNFTAETWTGTVAFENVTENGLKVSDFGNANSTIEFNNFTGYFDEAENGANNGANKVVKPSIVTNVTIVGTLNINNGWSNGSLVFDGNVTGDTFKFTKPAGNPTQEFVFNKMVDLTNVNLSGGSATVTFNGAETTVESLTLKADAVANLNGAATVGSLTLSENAVANLNGAETTVESLTLSANAVANLNGAATVGSLTLSADAVAKVSGSLVLTTGKGSDFEGTLEVLAGGTLTLSGHDALGFNGDGDGLDSGVISLQGNNSTEKASLVINDSDGNGNKSVTLSKTLELKGYSTVSATEGRSFNSWNGKIKASGIENEISSTIGLRKELIVDVEDGGKLIISGNMLDGQDPVEGGLLKSGSGELTLSGVNTYTQDTTIEAGTLVAAHQSALGRGNVTVKSGATLKLAVAVENVGNVSLEEGAMFAIDVTGMSPVSMMANGNETVALSILSSSALSFNGQDASSLINSDTIDGYFDDKNSNLGQWSEWQREWSYSDGTLSLTLTIPEPSAFGLLAGVGALALVASRRRRSRRG